MAVLGLLVAGCGGGGDPSGDDLAKKVGDAINQPGMVYHTVANDGTEVWIDAPDQLYLKVAATAQGKLLSAGQGWTVTSYDPFQNAVTEKDRTPTGPATPRINNPAVSWTDALSALGFGNTLDSTGKSTADGSEIWVVQANSPILDKNGNIAGSLAGRVEIDAKTNLPHAFERHQTDANGTTPTPDVSGLSPNRRIVYKTSEMIPRSSLASDFFDKAKVDVQVQTPAESLDKIRAIGLTPLWLGEQYAANPGRLQLPANNAVFAVAADKRGEVHYSLIVPTSSTDAQEEADAVIIRVAADATTFKSPSVPQFGGVLPEKKDSVMVNGQPATLYTSILTPSDLPCASGATCPQTDAKLYRRLIFAVGTTNVQVEAAARIGASGQDANGYNNKDAIVALAEALMEAPQSTATPTPGPVASPSG
jgi:hypothetical protein